MDVVELIRNTNFPKSRTVHFSPLAEKARASQSAGLWPSKVLRGQLFFEDKEGHSRYCPSMLDTEMHDPNPSMMAQS
jgi:hypothetical protein